MALLLEQYYEQIHKMTDKIEKRSSKWVRSSKFNKMIDDPSYMYEKSSLWKPPSFFRHFYSMYAESVVQTV